MRSLLLIALLPLTACQSSWEKDHGKNGHGVQPSGVAGKRSYDARDFARIELRGVDDVEVKNGAGFAVTAEGDTAILDELVIQVVDGTLRIGRKNRSGGWFGNNGDHGALIRVTMPRLEGATITGTGDMSVDKAEGAFQGAITGTGNLRIGTLTATEADLEITGTGDMTLAGTGTRLTANITGPGSIDARNFTAVSADITLMGPGDLKGNVTGDASIKITGPGDVDLTGGAKCSIRAMGPGEAKCS